MQYSDRETYVCKIGVSSEVSSHVYMCMRELAWKKIPETIYKGVIKRDKQLTPHVHTPHSVNAIVLEFTLPFHLGLRYYSVVSPTLLIQYDHFFMLCSTLPNYEVL